MNDQIKKQTNTGIALAIIGFAMIGGALVLIPQLVDEKVKRSHPAVGGTNCEQFTKGPTQKRPAVPQQAAASGATGEPDSDQPQSAPENQKSPESTDAASAEPAASGPSSQAWALKLVNRFEPDEASKTKLDTIVALMKSSPRMKLKIHGINNINKSSKLAMVGAARMANLISSESGAAQERLQTTHEQLANIENILVQVTVQGGAQ